jgi:hypothetical protein
MARPPRSPLLGYNHNVKYKGRVYHVQTEDSGPTNPRLFTHLYFEGTILASKRHEYDGESPEDTVRSLMQGQHKAILKELKAGLFDDRLGDFFHARHEEVAVGEADDVTPPVQPATRQPLPEVLSLDLDALPTGETPPPELPQTELPTGGPGIYTMRKATQRRYSDSRPPVSFTPPTSTEPNLPLVVFDPPPGEGRPPTRPLGQPEPRALGQQEPRALGQQEPRALGQPDPRRAPSQPGNVVVQRTVGVGAPGSRPNTPAGQRPRRPAPPIPYVVKEGSHPTVSSQARPAPPRAASPSVQVSPARPLVPPPTTSANAPRTSAAPPAAAPELISDKSLDEVILAYLSQGEGKD